MGFSLNPVKHLKKKARKLKKKARAPFSRAGRGKIFRKAARIGLTATGVGAAAVIAYDVKRTRDRSQNAKDAANRRTAQINAQIRAIQQGRAARPGTLAVASPGHTHLNPISDRIAFRRNGDFAQAQVCPPLCGVDRSRTRATFDNLGHIIKPRVGAAVADEDAEQNIPARKPLLAGIGGLAVVVIGGLILAGFASRKAA